MLEGGGQTPVLPPQELKAMGFAMAAYPTTLIFRVARTIERALDDIKAGKPIGNNDGVNFAEFKDITNYSEWARIEDEYRRASEGRHEALGEQDRGVGADAGAGCDGDGARARRPRCGSRSAASPRMFYLPLTVVERLGYFKDAGLDVEISDFPGGARALQALVGGSADVVTGAFDHTIQMQAKGQPIVGVVELGRFPGFVLALLPAKAAQLSQCPPISRA